MTNAPSAGSYDFADYLGVLRRRWRTILGLTLAGLLAAAAYVVVAPKTYTATALVYVTANAANSEELLGIKTPTVVNMDNEAQVVTSTTVARTAAALLKTRQRPIDLVRQVTVAVPANTQILQVSCSASSPSGASNCAEAFAQGYLTTRQNTALSKINQNISSDSLRLKKLESQLQAVETALNGLHTTSPGYIALHSRLVNIGTRIAPLRTAIAALGTSNDYSPGFVLTKAVPPSSPSSPRKLLYGPSGLMAGLLIGLGLAFFADRRDDRLHGPADVERFTGLPVLATLGHRPPDFGSALTALGSAQGRTFSEVSRVIANALGDGDQTLLISGSPDAGQVALNLAAALARTQSEVLLVLADGLSQSAPVLALSGLDAKRGLGAVAAGAATLADVARPFPGYPKLRVIAAEGGLDLFEELPAETVTRLARDFHATARYVVIAAEAAGGSGLIALAEFAKSAVIVADIGKGHRADIMLALRRLAQMRSRVLGAIVLPPPGRLSKAERQAYEAEQARQPQAAAYRAEPPARGPE
ncbi:MAG: Wzz/FepE/Etk N-terminal domain-containing protein, partial [Streptosporangiaceae bacterium]